MFKKRTCLSECVPVVKLIRVYALVRYSPRGKREGGPLTNVAENEAVKLSKMQRVRKRELRRASDMLHERLKAAKTSFANQDCVYGLRVAITLIGEMRKNIDLEVEDQRG